MSWYANLIGQPRRDAAAFLRGLGWRVAPPGRPASAGAVVLACDAADCVVAVHKPAGLTREQQALVVALRDDARRVACRLARRMRPALAGDVRDEADAALVTAALATRATALCDPDASRRYVLAAVHHVLVDWCQSRQQYYRRREVPLGAHDAPARCVSCASSESAGDLLRRVYPGIPARWAAFLDAWLDLSGGGPGTTKAEAASRLGMSAASATTIAAAVARRGCPSALFS